MKKVMLAFAAVAAFAISAWAEFATGWTATPMNATGTTIRPEGDLVYAWMGGAADYNTISTNVINGVKFAAIKSLSNRPSSAATMPFSISPSFGYDGANYGDAGVASTAYATMMANGWWNNSTKNYTFTLKNLEEGERYMVQLVFHNQYFSSTVTAPDGTTFVKAKGTDWTQGGTLVGVFDATNTVYEFALTYGDTPCFVNAIQVRKITGCEPVATNTWFLGNIGGSAYNGAWTVPDSGVTLDGTKYVLEEPEDGLAFGATEKRKVSSVQEVTFETSAKFGASYDELPEIDPLAKAGVVVANNNFYVLAKDTTTNAWTDTGISASSVLDSAVNVSVNVTNGTDGVHAVYSFGTGTVVDKLVVASGTWGDVVYMGSGEVTRLAGLFEDYPWPMPNGYSVLVDQDWAEANKITVDDFAKADKLGNGFSASESYVLGLNTNEALKLTWDREEYGSDATAATYFTVEPTVATRAKTLVNWCVYTNGVCEASGLDFESAPCRVFERSAFNTPGGEILITAIPKVSGQEDNPGSSDTIAVRCSDMLLNEAISYLAIPYECDVQTFLANFWDEQHKVTDQFDVYCAASNAWDTWKWSGSVGGTWSFVPTADRDEPYTTVLHPGQAVKITLNKSSLDRCTSKVFYIVGAPGDTSKTAVVAGKFNLIGSPNGADFQLSKLANGDRVKIVDPVSTNKLSVYALPNATYRQNKSNEWLYIPANTGAGTKVTAITNTPAFFLLPSESTINW